jgi:hypothetical protein
MATRAGMMNIGSKVIYNYMYVLYYNIHLSAAYIYIRLGSRIICMYY